MKTIFLISICALCFVYTIETKAQEHYPVIAMELQTVDVANNISNGIPDISDSTIFNVIMKVLISDTTTITNLQVTLKKSQSEQVLLISKSFAYDVFGTFSDNTTYTRNGYEITLNLGNYVGTIAPYAELIVSTVSTTTDPIIYF